VKNILFPDPVKTAEKYKFLRENNVFVGLFHTGLETDIEIANAVPELDLILGGHSHTKIDTGMIQNGVLITQASAYLQYVGETRISVKNGKVVKRTNRLVNLNELAVEDAEVKALLDKYKKEDPLAKVIGRAANNLEGNEKLGALMTLAIVEETGVDMAFQNAGGIRIDKIPQGDITLNTIYSLDPFGNDVVKLTMSYEEIANLLKGSLKRHELPDLYASGMSYRFDFDANNKLKSFEMFDVNGKPLDKNRKYTVGMNSYIYSKYEFKHEDPGAALGITASQTLINYIKRTKEIK
jgi:2',3'-cyclic-nucleotide 2'-phosphodiesterase (5'-nucleotidase family)